MARLLPRGSVSLKLTPTARSGWRIPRRALRGGSSPETRPPATELLEWLSPALAKVGGTLVQAEDELASINMALGASFGGVPALTATSGPGLSLMIESLGLGVAAEVPLVVVDVM